jgi:hypothetical protein
MGFYLKENKTVAHLSIFNIIPTVVAAPYE